MIPNSMHILSSSHRYYSSDILCRRYVMFSYIVNDSNAETHFDKTYELTGLTAGGELKRHVYRIKDLTEAINTSVLLDVDKKQTYNDWLTNDQAQFDASEEFVDICKEVGECDVY